MYSLTWLVKMRIVIVFLESNATVFIKIKKYIYTLNSPPGNLANINKNTHTKKRRYMDTRCSKDQQQTNKFGNE